MSAVTAGLRRAIDLPGSAPLKPLLILFGLNFVDEFDRAAFAALTPEIRDAFGLSDTGIGAIGVVAGAFIVVAALPLGFLADRFNRVWLSGAAALLWATMSVMTGLVPAIAGAGAGIALLFAVRILAGAGRTANEVLHPSLLNDYYEPRALPDVFKVHRLANPLGITSAVVAGVIGATLGWQWAFFLLSIPTFLLLLALTRLREPERGATIDPALAAEAADLDSIPLGEARRRLYAIRSLKRTWVSSFLIGTGAISIGQLLVLFFEQVYGFGPTGRGFITFLWGLGTVTGLFLGARLSNRVVEADDEPRLAHINGASGFAFATGLWALVAAPWAPLSMVAAYGVGIGTGLFQPAYYALVGRVAPPRIRSQAYAWAILFVATGALIGIVFFEIGDTAGYRLSLSILGAIVVMAGAVAWSAARFVRRDITQAEDELATAAQFREELETTGAQALLVCRGVEVAYDQVQVLFGVDLEVREGEIVALLGTNGAGKSTLLKAISGIVDPIGGAVYFEGRDITHADARHTAGLGITQVPGGRAVFPTLSVNEHLRLAAWLEDDEDAVAGRVAHVHELFPVLAQRADQLAGDLSGGEQQMLGLGMALVRRPRLLMIDELSLGLAPTIVTELLDVVRMIRDQGTSIIVVEQSVNVALMLAERAYFLEKGEVRFEGSTRELLERDDLVRSVFLAGAATGDGVEAVDRDAAGTPTVDDQGPPPLRTDGLTKRFGGITAVDDVSFHLQPGEILGVIGANGAGKTTVFDLISGFQRPDAGSVHVGEHEVTGRAPHERAWLGLGRSFQDARLVPSLSVAENLAIGLERYLDWHDHVAAALRMPDIVRQEEDVAWSVADLVELMGLEAYRDKLVRELSTGTRRVVDLAMVIAHDPDVLLLDEPSSGIAQRETEALGPLLLRIQRETGCALLVIEHDMPLITSIADRLIAMELGRQIAEGPPAEVVRDDRVVAAYLGGDLEAIRRSGEVGVGG